MIVHATFLRVLPLFLTCVLCARNWRKLEGENENTRVAFPDEGGLDRQSGAPYFFHRNDGFHPEFPPGFKHSEEFHRRQGRPANFPQFDYSYPPDDSPYLSRHTEDHRYSRTIPIDFIQNINTLNVTDLLLNFVEDDEEGSLAPMGLQDRYGDERNSAIVPKSATCMPEMQTVQLAKADDPSVLYIPQCTRIERCGGCCSHKLLSCQPTEIQHVTFQVVKTQYNGKRLKFVGKEAIVMDRHTKCKCDCKVKQEHCNSYQNYRKSECRCVCANSDEEKKCNKQNQTKLWDSELCSCMCREVTQCSTGFDFDSNECRCMASPSRKQLTEIDKRNDKNDPEKLDILSLYDREQY